MIDFIAENTFTIMSVHLLFCNIPNFYAYFQYQTGNPLYADFPVELFVDNAWVRYSMNTRLIGFFCGLIGSLLIAYIIGILKQKVRLAFSACLPSKKP